MDEGFVNGSVRVLVSICTVDARPRAHFYVLQERWPGQRESRLCSSLLSLFTPADILSSSPAVPPLLLTMYHIAL